MEKNIVVTGGSGKLGKACVKHLLDNGYKVFNVDRVKPEEELCPFVLADLADYGQTLDAFTSADFGAHDITGLVHLAAIPKPGLYTNSVTFSNNILSTYNAFEMARKLEIKNIVWASSETVLGLPFDFPPPYVPVDEEYAGRPESAYSLSKLLGEEMAKQFCRWDAEMKIVGLRFSNIMEPKEYATFKDFQDDPIERKWNLWGYVDVRDAAQAIRKALEAQFKGADVFIIANSDTVMLRSNTELLAEIFPNVPLKQKGLGKNETLLSIEKAKRLLGYEPRHSWRGENSE